MNNTCRSTLENGNIIQEYKLLILSGTLPGFFRHVKNSLFANDKLLQMNSPRQPQDSKVHRSSYCESLIAFLNINKAAQKGGNVSNIKKKGEL